MLRGLCTPPLYPLSPIFLFAPPRTFKPSATAAAIASLSFIELRSSFSSLHSAWHHTICDERALSHPSPPTYHPFRRVGEVPGSGQAKEGLLCGHCLELLVEFRGFGVSGGLFKSFLPVSSFSRGHVHGQSRIPIDGRITVGDNRYKRSLINSVVDPQKV